MAMIEQKLGGSLRPFAMEHTNSSSAIAQSTFTSFPFMYNGSMEKILSRGIAHRLSRSQVSRGTRD
jgi:hypothetical protein